ncbi:MAG TPA: MFS transporter, partial [Methanocella sp.]|nr:MFS transporter [Methanocella sp.]
MDTVARARSSLKYFDRQIWTLFTANIINVLGTSLVNTFLAIYIYENMGLPMTMVGTGFFISSIIGAISAYIGGSMADTIGRKKILMAGLAFQVIVYLMFSYAI